MLYWQLLFVFLAASARTHARSVGRSCAGQSWSTSQVFPNAKTPRGMLKTGAKYDVAVVPTRSTKQRFAMVPTEERNETSLSSLLDSREHWWISRYIKAIQRIPPVTGVYVALSTISALLSWALNENYMLDALQFDLQRVKRGELWRLITPFLNFGPLWLAHMFMLQSVVLYMSSVEISHCARPEKFVEFMAFGLALLSSYGVAEAIAGRHEATMSSAAYHLHTYVLYYWSRINEGSVVNCFDLFTLPAESVPLMFLLQNYLLYREFYIADIVAIGGAYVYFYYLFDTKPVWPLLRLRGGRFTRLYQRFNNEISR